MEVPTPQECRKALKEIGILNRITTKYSNNCFGGQDFREVIVHDFDPYIEGQLSPREIEKALPSNTILTIKPIKGVIMGTSFGSRQNQQWFFKDMRGE